MSHHVRSVQSSFTSPASASSWASSSPYATSSSSAHANLLGSLINKYPPGLGYGNHHHGDWRGSSSPSHSGLNGPATSGNGGSSYNPYTKRRSSFHSRPPVSSPSTLFSRRAAPPPPSYTRVQPPSSTYKLKFDPFSDENGADDEHDPLPSFDSKASLVPSPVSVKQQQAISDPVLYRTPRSGSTQPASITARSNNTFTIKLEPLEFAPPPPPVKQPVVDRNARSKLVAGILLNRVYAVGKPMRRRCVPQGPKEYVKSSLSSVVNVEA